ncbi:SulP family inorganic anion transporter [Cytobacillus oceanisediminis]|nr:SulP family inorganic anion transporter [Cytobacillus oceanisediminis]
MSAGIIVAVLFIPQSMAYAIIAGVPVQLGLYAGTLPLIVYTLFGSSKFLSVGPVSIVSLIAFSGISGITEPGSAHFVELIILLGLMVGFIHLIMSFFKVGDFFDFISPSVINGFISAAAIIIIVNQLKSIMGISLPEYQNFFQYVMEVIVKLPQVNPYTLTIGLVSVFILVLLKKCTPRSPGPLLVVLVSIFLVGVFDVHKMGVDIVGEIPKGLPKLKINLPSLYTIQLLFPTALIIAFISFLESYAVVKSFNNREKEPINTNKELLGLGLANIASSFTGSIPVAGALSRTAVNYQSGAKSRLALLLTASFIIISLLYLTPLFYFLPKASLAAIIMVAVSSLVKFKQYSLNHAPGELFIFLSTFISTLMLDIFWGLLIGIIFSILLSQIRKALY